MTGVITCPDCGARLPMNTPAGLCPRCLLRLGADLSNAHELEAGAAEANLRTTPPTRNETPTALPRIHLRDDVHDARMIRPASPEIPELASEPSRYQLVGELARGGMGAVFQVRDLDLGRDLAVKVIREEHCRHPEMLRRFVEEAQIGGQLQHPGIVPVHELGHFPDGRLFIAMKLVKGRTLAALLAARRKPDVDRVRFLAIFEQVCQTMAYAHARGVIHRDLKPSNIMVGSFGEVQVMDWGLAKVLDHGGTTDEEWAVRTPDNEATVQTLRTGSSEMESRSSSVLGTPSYMAPEQARGVLDTLDERADVFALGSILCEILTGQPAFAGESAAEVYRKAERADLADALARLDACGADGELTALARACLAPAPKHRPRNAGEVVAGLTAYLRGVDSRLREAELAQARAEAQAAGERRRRLLTLALAGSVCASTVIAAAGWYWMDRERRGREDALHLAVDAALADAGERRERALAGGGERVLWVEAIEAARRAESLVEGRDASAALRRRVRVFLDDLARERDAAERAERDRRTVERLAAIHNDLGVHNDAAKADAEYAAAFRPYGIDFDRLEPEAAGKALAASQAAVDLASGLDQWAILRLGPVLRDRTGAAKRVAAARIADPDPWRNQLRDTLGRMEGGPARRLEALERLAATADVDRLPVVSVTRLATPLAFLGRRDTAIGLLRRAQASHRGDFWVNADLGRELLASGRADEAVRFFAIATGVRPGSALALGGLGRALLLSGQPAEAAEVFRALIRLRPDDALAHVALGSALVARGERQQADTEFQKAKQQKPDDWMVRDQIAIALSDWGDWTATVAEQRDLVRRFPKLPVVHKALAHALQSAGRLEEAIAEFREAVRLDPRFAAAYLFLGRALIESGDLRQALDALAKIDAGPPSPDPFLNASTLVARAKRLVALEARFPAIVAERERPADAEEGVAFARLAFARRKYAAAARLWNDAFKASPPLAADLASWNRFQAARAAALAGAGEEPDESPPDVNARTHWREQARAWLEADLAASAATLESGNVPQRMAVSKRLGRWQVDPALAGLRDEASLDALPASERPALRQFWSRVAALRAKAVASDARERVSGENPHARL